MTPVRKQRISKKTVAGLLLGTAIVVYAFLRTAEFRGGPVLVLAEPKSPVADDHYTLSGQALRIAHLFLNDKTIFTDSDGHFTELFLLAPGSNIIRLNADDNFGRKTEKIIQLIYVPNQKTS